MGKAKELRKILNNPLESPQMRGKALDELATLRTREAIEAIGERARDPLELPKIRDKAMGYLGRKRK